MGRARTRFTLTVFNELGDTELYSYSGVIPVDTTLVREVRVEGAAERLYSRIPIVDLVNKAYLPVREALHVLFDGRGAGDALINVSGP